MAKASERDRYKYGVCTNRDKDGKPCPKCESKEVQKIRIGQDFVCEECKESIRQVPPPKPSTPWGKVIGVIVAVIIILGGTAAYFFVFKGSDNPALINIAEESILMPDSVSLPPPVEVAEAAEAELNEPAPEKGEMKKENSQPISSSSSVETPASKTTVSVRGGNYTGEVKGGKPHGQGTLTYNSRTRISTRDMKERYAETGQYIIGEFYEGELVQGKLFDTNNDPIESIILGRPR